MTGNPIEAGANQIKTQVEGLITQGLNGIFPKNYEYMCADYNRVFVTREFVGERAANMVTLGRGGFESGIVPLKVSSDHMCWRFAEANLSLAKDIDVVRYSPILVLLLMTQLENELGGQAEPTNIKKALLALSERNTLVRSVFATSYSALREMGEDNPILPGERGEKTVNQILHETPMDEMASSLRKKMAAFAYYDEREKLQSEVAGLCAEMRAKPVEEWFVSLAARMAAEGTFPATGQNDGINWFAPRQEVRSGHPYDMLKERPWSLIISGEGEVKEAQYHLTSDHGTVVTIEAQRKCPEHLLEHGGEIASRLVQETVKSSFPAIKF